VANSPIPVHMGIFMANLMEAEREPGIDAVMESIGVPPVLTWKGSSLFSRQLRCHSVSSWWNDCSTEDLWTLRLRKEIREPGL